MIDPHVHLRDWNEREKETLIHGMESGYKAGIDVFFDMPNTSPAITSRVLAEKRIADGISAEKELLKKGITVHYHLYLGLTADKAQIKEMVETYNDLYPRVVGLKLFASHSTGDMGIIDEEKERLVWDTLSSLHYKGVVAVHAEKTSLFASSPSHALSRPPRSEEASVEDMIEFATLSSFKGTLHISHVSTKGALDAIKRARKDGKIRVTVGATPHHALFSMERENKFLKMNPPLRPEEDRNAIFSALLNGEIDWIESDHAPHTLMDKEKGKCGIPGFKGTLLLISRLRQEGIREERLVDLLNNNTQRVFGVEKSTILPPFDIEKREKEIALRYPFDPFS